MIVQILIPLTKTEDSLGQKVHNSVLYLVRVSLVLETVGKPMNNSIVLFNLL